jgi:hypothetical protein
MLSKFSLIITLATILTYPSLALAGRDHKKTVVLKRNEQLLVLIKRAKTGPEATGIVLCGSTQGCTSCTLNGEPVLRICPSPPNQRI